VHVRLDERSAAFYAVGIAKASRLPVIVCTTSGTAAVELHPAVVEAHHGLVPLLVCTADRPPELQGIGAPQTIDQVGLFTSSTRWAMAVGVPEEQEQGTWRALAQRSYVHAAHDADGPGPVHLNLAFRDPLVGESGPLPETLDPLTPEVAHPDKGTSLTGSRGLIVAGANAVHSPAALLALAESLGWPLLADPLSGCRLPGTIAASDALMRSDDLPLPETVLVLGTPPISKVLGDYLTRAASGGTRIISVDPHGRRIDPHRVVTDFHHADPDDFMAAAATELTTKDPDWLAFWQDAEDGAQAAIDRTLGDRLTEPFVARSVARHAADADATIVVSASMPLRDLEWFAPTHQRPPRVLANRGANGIDGIVSTAFGVASTGQPTIALLGDLAFLHDVSGLVNLDAQLPCTFVVPDNGGGGIFSFLPQATAFDAPSFELLFGTPPTSDVGAVATGFGLGVTEVTTVDQLTDALLNAPTSPHLIRVRVPSRRDNVALHEEVNQAVRLSLEGRRR
jgi:2-succinyl-5-enolpyruvyl-6-hydroxy-3-cyclohexene-1-carboxylate synthase